MEGIISLVLLEDYFIYRREKGVEQTKSGKQQTQFAIQSLNEFVNKCYPTITLRELRPLHLKRFMNYLEKETKLKGSSISGRFNQLRSFFLFCQEKDLIDKDPLIGIETPLIPVEKAPCITQEEWNKILSAIESSASSQSDTHRVYRDLTMLEFLAYTACSLEEISVLSIAHIDLKKGFVRFIGTNKSQPREIPLPKELVTMLNKYFRNHRDAYGRAKSSNSEAFFQTSKSTFQRTVRIYSELALGKRYTVEDIRASRISALLKNVGSVWAISEFLGIHDLARLRRYVPDAIFNIIDEYEKIKEMPFALPEKEGFYLKSFFKRKDNRNLRRV